MGQEGSAYGVGTRRGELEVDDRTQEGVGHLHCDASAVTGVDLGTGRTTVVEVVQRGQRLLDDRVGGTPVQVGDEGDATGIVLESRVVEALCGRDGGERDAHSNSKWDDGS